MGRPPKTIAEVAGKLKLEEREYRASVEPICYSKNFFLPDELNDKEKKEFKKIIELIRGIQNHPASDADIGQIIDLSKWLVRSKEAEKRWTDNGCKLRVMTATKIDADGISKGMELKKDEDYEIMLDSVKVIKDLRKQLCLDISSRARVGTIANNLHNDEKKLKELEEWSD